MKPFVIVSVLTFSAKVFAHGGVYSYEIDGKTYPGYKWFESPDAQSNLIQRRWYKDPVQDPLSPNITCNYNGDALPGSYHAPIQAGHTITANWSNNYPFADRSLGFYCDPERMKCPDPNTPCVRECLYHQWYHATGPLMAYMADCGGDCDKAEPSELKWFKIAEAGLRPGYLFPDSLGWPQGDLQGQSGKPRPGWTVTIPKTLKPGKYMIRHEILMLELMPPQFYPECAHLEVDGDGTATPDDEYLVKFPGAYSMDDPGIKIAGLVYYPEMRNVSTYIIPGPKVWIG